MKADWELLPSKFYEDMIIYSVVRGGLYKRLQQGVDRQALEQDFQHSELLRSIIEILIARGLLKAKGNHLVWSGPVPDGEVLRSIDQLREWMGLAERLVSEVVYDPQDQVDEVMFSQLEQTGTALFPWVLEHISPERGSCWLDIGGGTGGFAYQLVLKGAQVTMVEKPRVIAWIREKFPERARTLNLWDGNVLDALPEGQFDGVTLIRVIEDWKMGEVQRFLRRLARIVVSNGSVYIIGYFKEEKQPEHFYFDIHVRLTTPGQSYDLDELSTVVDHAGFRVVQFISHPWAGYGAIQLKRRDDAKAHSFSTK